MTTTTTSSTTGQIRLLLSGVFLIYLGQMALSPIIAPLARAVGLAEWQVGATISTAAVMVVATSQRWGRLSQSWGRKPVLMAGYLSGAIALGLFAAVSWGGVQGLIGSSAVFAMFLLLRGIAFGGAIASVYPTAQAFIADVTTTESERVKGMAGLGAVQGLSMVVGAVVGGMLVLAGLMTPLLVIPLLILMAFVVTWRFLRGQDHVELVADPPKVKATDPRVWPFLVMGFGLFFSLGLIQVVIGFIVMDRLGLGPEMSGMLAGLCLLASGIGMIVGQAAVVPRTGWGPPALLRVGSMVAVLGFALLVPDCGLWLLLVASFMLALGLGIAVPGYTAGPSLRMDREEQGGLAGLMAATNGLTFVAAPTLGTFMYGINPLWPTLTSMTVCAAITVFAWIHPGLHSHPGNTPTPRSRATTTR